MALRLLARALPGPRFPRALPGGLEEELALRCCLEMLPGVCAIEPCLEYTRKAATHSTALRWGQLHWHAAVTGSRLLRLYACENVC